MGVFGWSLPPGVTTLPGEEDEGPCEVCGHSVDSCICEECPVCGEYGNTLCYLEHDMVLSPEQIKGLEAVIDYYAEEKLSMEEYWEEEGW